MTADGELYVDETCRDVFMKKLNKVFGKDKWSLDGSKYCNTWDLSDIPKEISVDIKYGDKVIGKAVIQNKHEIVYDNCGMSAYITATPISLEVVKHERKSKSSKRVKRKSTKLGKRQTRK